MKLGDLQKRVKDAIDELGKGAPVRVIDTDETYRGRLYDTRLQDVDRCFTLVIDEGNEES